MGQADKPGSLAEDPEAFSLGWALRPPVPQSPPRGNPAGPPNLGGGSSPGQPSAAVAYAIQQGGVDSKPLGKPFNFNPLEGKVSFLDWDSIITISDANMPGCSAGPVSACGLLSRYTVGEARSIVRQAKRPNGYEAFRLLMCGLTPARLGGSDEDHELASRRFFREIGGRGKSDREYESRAGAERVSDAMRMAGLVHMAPQALKQHLHMNAARYWSCERRS